MKIRTIAFTTALILTANYAFSQNWNDPNVTHQYVAADSTGDSVVIWNLDYDTAGNVAISTSKSGYLGNSQVFIHSGISDPVMQPMEGTCSALTIDFTPATGYSYYVFNMEDLSGDYTTCYQKKMVIVCNCVGSEGCCTPSAMPAGSGLNVTCVVDEGCLKCEKPSFYYIDADGDKVGETHHGSFLVVKAKSFTYSSN